MKTDLSKAVIYQLYPRTFTSEGTLKAAEKLIPHLYDLGIDIIYMSACNTEDTAQEGQSERQRASGLNNAKNPYRITDYFNVDDEYGTIDDLRDFVRTAHEYGLKVLIDLVYLHCGANAVFLDEHPEFVVRDEDGKIKIGETWPFARFNYAEKSLREYLWSNMEFYISDVKADGFRCDVGCDIPLDFWAEGIRRIREINPDVIMLNEGSDPAWLSEFDINYCIPRIYDLNDVFINAEDARQGRDFNREDGQMTPDIFKKRISQYYAETPEGKLLLNDSQNHDTASDLADRRPEVYLGSAAAEAILALIFTLKGVPMIYNGDEVADTAPKSMFWNRFCTGVMSVQWHNLLTEKGRKRIDYVKKLIRLRHFNDAVSSGDFAWYEGDCAENIIAFVRGTDESTVTVFVNADNTEQTLKLNGGRVILSNNACVNGSTAILNSYGVLIVEN